MSNSTAESKESVNVRASGYWSVRDEILKAIRLSDEDALKAFEAYHPDVFKNVLAQAKNWTKRYGKKSG